MQASSAAPCRKAFSAAQEKSPAQTAKHLLMATVISHRAAAARDWRETSLLLLSEHKVMPSVNLSEGPGMERITGGHPGQAAVSIRS